jgi:hypothetical protein
VNGRLATVNMPTPQTDSRPVNDPLTIRLAGCMDGDPACLSWRALLNAGMR